MKAGAPLSDADLRQSAFVTTLKAEAALDCAHAPPTALNDGRWGASIELSEAWLSGANLRPELGGTLLWPHLPKAA